MYTFLNFVDRLVDEVEVLERAVASKSNQLSTRQTYYASKAKDTGTTYVLTAEIPGFEREEIALSVVGEYLHLDAKNADRAASKGFLLPSDASKEGIDATLKNGIITIRIQKKSSDRMRIEVK